MIGLYIHIPFCLQKCNYCDFLSFASTELEQENYIDALVKEIEIYGRSGNYRLASVYFGGGTPTLLKDVHFRRLFIALHRYFTFADNAEITVEANPGTIDLAQAETLHTLGVNRISLGVQSLQDDELQKMGRIHTSGDVGHAVNSIVKAGITNYSFDLMGGLPGQTQDKLLDTVRRTIELEPKHISLYGLKLEDKTPWFQLYQKGKLSLPDEDQSADMMLAAQDLLQSNGYLRYEISNYAQKGYESIHNLTYWLNDQYLGIGLGAASFFGKERFTNERNYQKYICKLKDGESCVAEKEKITGEIEQSETIFLGLRLTIGVDLRLFRIRFGKELTEVFEEPIKKHVALGLLEITSSHLRLTPRGFQLANEVMQDFI